MMAKGPQPTEIERTSSMPWYKKSIPELCMQPSKTPASSDGQPLGIPAWFDLPTVDELASTDNPQF
jgi:hypothetical protein